MSGVSHGDTLEFTEAQFSDEHLHGSSPGVTLPAEPFFFLLHFWGTQVKTLLELSKVFVEHALHVAIIQF